MALIAFAGLIGLFGSSTAADIPSHMLWDVNPAPGYVQAFPIGNGRLGAMLYGGLDNDLIQLNEDSIWSGAWSNRVNPKAKEAFSRVRSLMDQGDITAAGKEIENNMASQPDNPRAYQPAGDIKITVNHNSASNYNRTLDLSTGVFRVSYDYEGARYTRRAVANDPLGVIGLEYTSDQSGKISMDITMTRDQGASGAEYTNEGGVIRGTGTADDSYTFTSKFRVVSSGGTQTSDSNGVYVQGADTVTLFWDAETLFYHPAGPSNYEPILQEKLDVAASRGFSAILADAVADHAKYFDRVSLNLGSAGPGANLPTTKRIDNMKASGDASTDPELLTLMYNFGRYATICATRPNSLPPNLQGIWNNNFSPPWGSKFTLNVNVEMNHWHTEISNLPELMEPIWSLLRRMNLRGKQVAQDIYGLTGAVCHHNTDYTGDCAPVDSGPALTLFTLWPQGMNWLLSHTSEHYRFTRDKAFVTNTALPLMADAITFYNQFAVEKDDRWDIYPSLSPENAYYIPEGQKTAGTWTGLDRTTEMDKAILWDLYSSFIELSDAVGSSNMVQEAQNFLAKLAAPSVSPTTGRLLEWSQDYEDRWQPGHRHFSNLYGLHPGNQFSPITNSTLSGAAGASLDRRMSSGSGSTGWSRIWASALYGRLLNGDKALSNAVTLITGYTFPNLFAITDGIFQMDANFGFTHAIQEMFLQSHADDTIHLGPAIPSTKLGVGHFKGWKARGAFTVDAEWNNQQIVGAVITASVDGPLKIRVQDGRVFRVNGEVYSGPIMATSGQTYTLSF